MPTTTLVICIPQVEIFRELKASVDVFFHFTVYAWHKLREWKSFWKRFLQQQKRRIMWFSQLQTTILILKPASNVLLTGNKASALTAPNETNITKLFILVLENWYTGSNAPSVRSPATDEETIRPIDDCYVSEVSAYKSL